jgi:hypothetical protein
VIDSPYSFDEETLKAHIFAVTDYQVRSLDSYYASHPSLAGAMILMGRLLQILADLEVVGLTDHQMSQVSFAVAEILEAHRSGRIKLTQGGDTSGRARVMKARQDLTTDNSIYRT